MLTPCPRPTAPDVLPGYLLCPEDALDVLAAVEADHPDTRQIALVVDRDRRGLLAMPVIGEPDEPDTAIDHVADVLLEALAANPDGPMGVVLCSLRPGPEVDQALADVDTWRRLQAHFQEADVELLDWFVSDGPEIRSMAETCEDGWPDPPGLDTSCPAT